MLLLQFSTSHYCRKARLGLGYKKIPYRVENLTPGFHIPRLKPLTGGTTTLPVLLPEIPGHPEVIADSSEILQYLESYFFEPSFMPADDMERQRALILEDWLDESIGIATRFLYYDYRSSAGIAIDPSLKSRFLVNIVRFQYGITPATVKRARERLDLAFSFLSLYESRPYLIGDALTIVDITAAALLSPLALIPDYHRQYPRVFAKIADIHRECGVMP